MTIIKKFLSTSVVSIITNQVHKIQKNKCREATHSGRVHKYLHVCTLRVTLISGRIAGNKTQRVVTSDYAFISKKIKSTKS